MGVRYGRSALVTGRDDDADSIEFVMTEHSTSVRTTVRGADGRVRTVLNVDMPDLFWAVMFLDDGSELKDDAATDTDEETA